MLHTALQRVESWGQAAWGPERWGSGCMGTYSGWRVGVRLHGAQRGGVRLHGDLQRV